VSGVDLGRRDHPPEELADDDRPRDLPAARRRQPVEEALDAGQRRGGQDDVEGGDGLDVLAARAGDGAVARRRGPLALTTSCGWSLTRWKTSP
jgi:hypothetical protein